VQKFIARFRDRVIGALSGFDRVLFRGQPRHLSYPDGLAAFLWRRGVLLKDFGAYVRVVTDLLRERMVGLAQKLGRPVHYLESSRDDKEDLARGILRARPTEEGLICLLSCVEPCMTYQLYRNRETKHLELRRRSGKCLHYYTYLQHRTFGVMHVRLQTWFPFTAQVCINGREWLARDLEDRGIDFQRFHNSVYAADDLAKAQGLLDRQLRLDWPTMLDRVLGQWSPGLCHILDQNRPFYYWCAHQTEWASDVLFQDRAALQDIYPALVRHAVNGFSSRDVLRFLGRKPHHAFAGEVTTDLKHRAEGIRIKHWVGDNSLKMYDKHSALRIESTINDPRQLRAPRPNASTGALKVQPIRKTVADLGRMSEVCQRANDRYMDALADLEENTPVKDLTDPLSRHTTFHGRRVRALRFSDKADIDLLTAVNRGDFILTGFRNHDIATILFPKLSGSAEDTRKRSAKVSRLLRILRAHGVIRKLPHSRRYHVTNNGRTLIAAVLAARAASVSALLKSA